MMEYYTAIKNIVQVLLKNPLLSYLSRGIASSIPLENKPQDTFVPLFSLLPHPHSHLQLTTELYAYQHSSEFVPKCVYTFGTCHCNGIT